MEKFKVLFKGQLAFTLRFKNANDINVLVNEGDVFEAPRNPFIESLLAQKKIEVYTSDAAPAKPKKSKK